MASEERVILCEGEDIEDKVSYAEDLVEFLTEQVGSKNVGTSLASPEQLPDPAPALRASRSGGRRMTVGISSRLGCQPELYFIGEAAEPSESKAPRKQRRTKTLPGGENATTFFIGDEEAAEDKQIQSFFIGDSKRNGSSRHSSTKPCVADPDNAGPYASPRLPIVSKQKNENVGVYGTPRLLCCNLLADDSDASTSYTETPRPGSALSESSFAIICEPLQTPPIRTPIRQHSMRSVTVTDLESLMEADATPEWRTPVNRMLEFTRDGSQLKQDPDSKDWKGWVCGFGCAVRDRE